MISLGFFIISLVVSAYAIDTDSVTPPAPLRTTVVGATKAERIAYFQEFLDKGTPEQKAVYRDDNPVLKEVQKFFNSTMFTQVTGYLVHKAMLSSPNMKCDVIAIEKADKIMAEAFDETVDCMAQFRQRVRTEVQSDVTNIGDIPDELRSSLILPVDECYETVKDATMNKFGKNTADHLICSKKIKF